MDVVRTPPQESDMETSRADAHNTPVNSSDEGARFGVPLCYSRARVHKEGQAGEFVLQGI